MNGLKVWGGAGADEGRGVAVDGNGNVYVTGYLPAAGADFNPGGSGGALTSAGSNDVFVAKYAPGGTFLWAKSMGGTGDDLANSVAVDAGGNVYVVGNFRGTSDFDPGLGTVNIVSAGSNIFDVFLAKYDPNGGFLWAKSMGGVGVDNGYGVAADGNGNVYVTGTFASATADFNPGGSGGVLTRIGSNSDVFLAKYDPGGGFLWAKSMGGTDIEQGYGVAVDGNSNVYITGIFGPIAADFNPGGSGGVLTSAGSNDVFLAKYAPGGGFLWAKSMGGTAGDYGQGVAADANGNVYVTGYFAAAGANFNPGGSGGALTSAGGTGDVFVAKYAPDGGFLWAKGMGGTGVDRGQGVAADVNGNVYVTGYFAVAGANFNPGGSGGALTSAGGNDVFVARYDAGGTFLWAKSMGGTGADYGQGVAADANGNVYVTGRFSAPGADFNPGGLGGGLTSAGSTDAFVVKLSQPPCNTFATLTASACNSYTLNGQTYTSTGSYQQTFTNAANCDSIVTLNLTINNNSSTVSQVACNSFVFNSITYTASGAYTGTFANAAGCDSVVTLNLTINHSSPVTRHTETACDSFTFLGQTYTQSGTYADTFTNTAGCDSIVTLDLTVNYASDTVLALNACDSLVLNDSVYTISGTYIRQVLPTVSGCDSTITLNVTINHPPEAAVIRNGSTLTANTADSYQWINCDDNSIITGATGQSYTAIQNGEYAVIITSNGCSDTSDCVLVDNISSINEWNATDNTISLYPNPADSKITIRTQQALKQATIRLVNMVGQVLTEQKNQHGTLFTLDIAQLAGGIYFVEINEGGKTVSRKVVKEW